MSQPSPKVEVAAAAPGIAYAAATWVAGWSPEQWVTALTLLYLGMCISTWIWSRAASLLQWVRNRKATKRMDFEQQPRDAVGEDCGD